MSFTLSGFFFFRIGSVTPPEPGEWSANNVVTGSGGFSLEVKTSGIQLQLVIDGAMIAPLASSP